MNLVTPLVRTTAIAVEQFAHAPGERHRDPDEEAALTHALSFIEHGSFHVGVGGSWRHLTAQNFFATTPGMPFRCRHDDEYPDDRCLVVRFTDAAVESLRSLGARAPTEAVLPLTNRRAYLRLALRSPNVADDEGPDPARAEAIAGELYWTLAPQPERPRPLYRAHQLHWYAERIRQSKELIRAHHAEPLSLSRIARESGMSVYHFARVFHELEGQPPHRFLVEVRLAEAAARLRAGDGVTATCHAVGFGSLSHFVTSFRRRFGLRPGEVARGRLSPR